MVSKLKIGLFLAAIILVVFLLNQTSPTVMKSTVSSSIPFKDSALVWLDGKVGVIGSDTFFLDKSGNSRNFKITNCDFDISNVQKGFPYKSLAKITAPAGDATLMAADDSMFYKNGLPDTISVTSLFQDINYTHRLFTRHTAQVVDATGKEVYAPRVVDIVVYSTTKVGTNLSKCLAYYGVPAEDTAYNTTAVWLSEQGNDANAGTKTSPKKTINGIKATTKTNVYLRSGNFNFGASNITFTGSSLNILGTGNSNFYLVSATTGCTVTRPLTFKNCDIKDSASSLGFSQQRNMTFERCRLSMSKGSYLINIQAAGYDLTVKDCILPAISGTSFIRNSAAPATITLDRNYGVIKNVFTTGSNAKAVVFRWNKVTGSVGNTFYDSAFTYKDNSSSGIITANAVTSRVAIENETILGGISISDSAYYNNCTITGTLSGQVDSIMNTTITGKIDITPQNILLLKGVNVTSTTDVINTYIRGTQNSPVYSVTIDSCVFTGNMTAASYLVHVGAIIEGDTNSIKNITVTRSKIINQSTVGTGTCHTLFSGGMPTNGSLNVAYNDITVNNGYGIVIKSGGVHLDTSRSSVRYNLWRVTGTPSRVIYGKGTWGIKVFNNTVSNAKVGVAVFETNDNNGGGLDNSMICVNNMVSVAANLPLTTNNSWMSTRNNVYNPNGFTVTAASTDSSTSVTLDANLVPSAKLDYGEIISGTDNDKGLDETSIIPSAIIYRYQTTPWQRGAIVKQ